MRKATILGILSLSVVVFPFAVEAESFSILLSQTTKNSNTTADFNIGAVQGLGNGISGILSGIQFGFKTSTITATSSLTAYIAQCNTNSYNYSGNLCTAGQVATSSVDAFSIGPSNSNNSDIEYTFDFTAKNINLDPSKYIFIIIQYNSSNGGIKLLGSNTDTYSNGSLATLSGGNSISPLQDAFFYIWGQNLSNPISTVTNPQPRNNATTTTSTTFTFDYNAVASNSIDEYVILLYDNTNLNLSSSTPIRISGTASTGSHSVSRTLILTDGHLYSWVPYICNTGSGMCYGGGTNLFGVGTSSQTLLDQAFYQGTTTSTASGSSDFYGIIPLISKFVNKVPFGYVSQIVDMWNAQVGSGSNFPLIDLDLHSLGLGSTTVVGNFLPDLKVSTTTVRTYMPNLVYNGLIALQDVSYWGFLALYMWRRGRSLFRAA